LSFPSGHAASAAVCYLTFGLMLAQTQASAADVLDKGRSRGPPIILALRRSRGRRD
jgi:membrane-associated phospholipid phosphatase